MKDNNQKGFALWGIIVVIVVLAVVAGIIIAGSSGGSKGSNDGSSGESGGMAENRVCHTYCMGVVQLECGSNKAVGACLGAWDCSPPDKGDHLCERSDGY